MSLIVPVAEIVKESSDPLLAVHPDWERVPLAQIAEILNGFAFKSALFSKSSGMPLVRIRDVGDDQTECMYDGPFEERYLVRPGDLIVGMDGDFNTARWRGTRALLNQRVCRVDLTSKCYDPRFLDSALPGYLNAINQKTSSVTVKHLSSRSMAEIPLPLPPLAEQKRIAAIVEKLLERVNAARDRLSKVPTIIKRFRQSVLAAACSGRLTADWRDAHPDIEPADTLLGRILDLRHTGWSKKYTEPVEPDPRGMPDQPESWCFASLDQLISTPLANGRSVADAVSGFPVLRLTAVRSGRIGLTERKTGAWTASDAAKYLVSQNNFLVVRGNGSLSLVGRGGLVEAEPDEVAYPDTLIRVRVNAELFSVRFLRTAWDSDFLRNQIEAAAHTTAGIHKVSQVDLRRFVVPVPPHEEQHEIVRRVEALFKLAAAIEGRVAAGTQRADKLTQSILAKAFRGELVPTEAELARQEDRSYEPASVLLERIKAEREATEATKPKRGRKRRKKAEPKVSAQTDGEKDAGGESHSPPDEPEPTRRRRQPESPDQPARKGGADHDGRRRDIDDYETDEVMAAFRQVYRGRAKMPEDDLLLETARRFGFGRLGSSIKDRLKGHLRAAIRRKILIRKRDIIELETFHMEEYTRDELVDAIDSVMVKGREYERDEVIDAVARYLGFTRLRDTVTAPIKSAINAAIRRDAITGTGRSLQR